MHWFLYYNIPLMTKIMCTCVISCVFMWFPLLEAGCGGLERCCVIVLVVWYGAL